MSVFLATMSREELAGKVEKYRILGLVRVPLDQIGCWLDCRRPCTEHVRDLAEDIVTKGTNPGQYGGVNLVKIPAAFLDYFRGYNKAMCDRADYMPLFNADMVYVLLTKTHFTFAHMLIRDGGRTLHDYKMGTGMRDIKLLHGDREGQMIQ